LLLIDNTEKQKTCIAGYLQAIFLFCSRNLGDRQTVIEHFIGRDGAVLPVILAIMFDKAFAKVFDNRLVTFPAASQDFVLS
jgi:hypothetical protein